MDSVTKEQMQEVQYVFPYHHLTHEENGGFFLFKHLFWGLTHYTYIQYVIDKILETDFQSLADIGCGEGRIICELERRTNNKKLLGVDISERAIKFARAFSKSSDFKVQDITRIPLAEPVDCIVSCEVIEHIEPSRVTEYIQGVYGSLKQGGTLIITTPTTNVPVNAKHYQHFTAEMFDELLAEKFSDITYSYLNRVNVFSKILERILANRLFLSNSKTINKFVLQIYRKHLLVSTENRGSRIVVKAIKS